MPRSARRQASCAYEFGLIPITELPLRSVGPEPAMITATGIRRVVARGRVSVPESCIAPLLIVYGDSTATAGGSVSAVCSATATSARLRTAMLFSLPDQVGVHDRDHDHDDNRGDDQRQEHAVRQEGAGAYHEPSDDH